MHTRKKKLSIHGVQRYKLDMIIVTLEFVKLRRNLNFCTWGFLEMCTHIITHQEQNVPMIFKVKRQGNRANKATA